MSFDLNLFSSKILKCRKNLDLKINEVAQKLGINIDRLISLEEGKTLPTGDEILIFSDFYKQDYQFFITNQYKSALEQVQILYRRHGDAFSKKDRWAIQEFIYLCECEQLAYDAIKKEFDTFEFVPTGDYFIAHGIEAAKLLRTNFNLQSNSLIHNAYQLFRKLGIHIFRRRLDNSSISGLFIMHPIAGKCILINYDEDIYRQNFTIAHEVGHALFDNKDEVNISFTKWNVKDLKETRANAFASNFLMPPAAFFEIKNINWNKDVLLNLARQMKVNTLPLLIALKGSKIISNSLYEQLKIYKIPMNEKVDPELIGLSEKRYKVKSELMEKGLSEYYIKVCYDAYDQGFISAQRLSEMLLVDMSELTNIMDLFNLQLKYND